MKHIKQNRFTRVVSIIVVMSITMLGLASTAIGEELQKKATKQHNVVKNQQKKNGIKIINPTSLYDGSAFSLSQATVDIDSGLVYVSGQVDWNTNYEVINESIEKQAANVMKNIAIVLKEANSSMDNILRLRIYVRGELADHIDIAIPVIVEHLNGARPAMTGIGVASLSTPNTLIEIEAVAKVKK